ncbi:MAG: hypothetical protein RI885_617, partial [Actinomycetota bacterium]
MTQKGGVGSLSLVFGLIFGSAAPVLARALSDIRWDGSTTLFVAGAVSMLGAALLSALEDARARSDSFAVRAAGVPMAICLGTIWAIEVGFAFGRLDMDPSSRDAVGFLGLALAMLAVP